jgi:carbon-monoxide dehydrogenase medium subunit
VPDGEPRWLWPTTLDEALAERARLGDGAMVVAGGVWATLLLNQGLVQPEAFLALGRVPGLDAISLDADGALRLGATARLSAVAGHPLVRQRLPFLADTYARVANERVRNQGTVGGNTAEADYASDPPTTLAALDAEVELAGARGTRRMRLRDFLVGHYQTQLGPDELIVGLRVPPAPDAVGHYLKFVSRSSEDRPCAGVAAVVRLDPDGRCRRLDLAIGAVAATPAVFPDLNAEALGQPLSDGLLRDLAEAYAARIEPLSDLRGSADYRRRLVRALLPRAVRAAIGA